MARPSARQRIEALIAEYTPVVKAAFLESIRDIVGRAKLAAIAAHLERGDIAAALRAVRIDPAAFQPFDLAVREAYTRGGRETVESFPRMADPDGGAFVIRFDVRNERAEAWLAETSSAAITLIVEDQIFAIRQALTEGLAAGRNPRSTALDIIGRINRVTGRREGGIIGLTSPQERYVSSARQELRSGDPALLRAYLGRTRRDKRFDAAVRKAIEAGKPLDAATVNRIAGRYSDRLLQLRGETIARTEIMGAVHASQEEAYRQAVESGAVRQQDVRKSWLPPPKDKQARENHQAMRGETIGLDERYSNGLRYARRSNAACACVLRSRNGAMDQRFRRGVFHCLPGACRHCDGAGVVLGC